MRQISLPEVGREGQQKLANAKCLVVGAGGLGCPALSYLVAAGIGTIGICDFDCVDLTNLHRQVLYAVDDMGAFKADVAAKRLKKANPQIEIRSIPERVSEEICRQYDLIVDGTDNFQTKFFLNDVAFLHQIPLVRASLYRFEGQLQCYLPKRGDACLRCVWEEIPREGCVGSCAEVGVLGTLPGFFGVLQAMETLKYFLDLPVLSTLLLYDLMSHQQKQLALQKNPTCPLCGQNPLIKSVGCVWEVEAKSINLEDFILVDIREESEVKYLSLQNRNFQHFPLSQFDSTSIDPQKSYLFFCQKGRRSYTLVDTLRKEGFSNTFSLIGGIESLIDSSNYEGKNPLVL